MRGDEARLLLGFPPTSRVTLSQIKAAYKSKAWEYHPDRVPVQEKPGAESKFKLISEAYNFLLDGNSCLHIVYERSNAYSKESWFANFQMDWKNNRMNLSV
ncbi:unnamed protein product, partial [Vitis vinifera]